MSVKIRLRRIGRKKQPYYRLVVIDSASPRDGAYLDTVGFYNPGRSPAELRMDLDKVDAWTSKGAEMTDTMRSLVRKARKGGDAKVELVTLAAAAAAAEAAEAPAAAPSLRGTPDRLEAPSAQPEAAPEPSADTQPAPAGPPPETEAE
jgi:small subunit ribosomal protein S16